MAPSSQRMLGGEVVGLADRLKEAVEDADGY